MSDITFKLEGSLGYDGNKSQHQDGSNRIWAFSFGHKLGYGWDSATIEELNDVYRLLKEGKARTNGLLVAIPRNGGGEIPISDFNLNLFDVRGKLRPSSFNIHVYKYEGGQFPASRQIAFYNASKLSVKSTIFQPHWSDTGEPIGFGKDDPSFDTYHFTFGDYEIF